MRLDTNHHQRLAPLRANKFQEALLHQVNIKAHITDQQKLIKEQANKKTNCFYWIRGGSSH